MALGQSLALSGPQDTPEDLGQTGGSPSPILTRGSARVSEASKLFRRWMRCWCGGSRTDSGRLTLEAVTVQALLQVSPGCNGPTCTPSRPQAPGSAPLCRCPCDSHGCPAHSGHSPDLHWLHQGPCTPLVPWLPAQAAGGARIRRYQKQAPVDTVTVHTCETREEQKSLLSWGT